MAKTAFKIPLQSEVEVYMIGKMGWPDKFCKHYADKFWNHYAASGWKLSNGNAIKDWQACFNSQWKQIKYKEDQELLNSMAPKNGVKMTTEGDSDFERLEVFLSRYLRHPTDIRFEDFAKWYEFMKEQKLMKEFSKGEVAQIRELYGKDNMKCRSACVQLTLNQYANTGFRIADILKMRQTI